jgi:hypothetical protein
MEGRDLVTAPLPEQRQVVAVSRGHDRGKTVIERAAIFSEARQTDDWG